MTKEREYGPEPSQPPDTHAIQVTKRKVHCSQGREGGGLFRTAENSATKSAVQINGQADVASSIASRNVIWNTSDRGQKVTQLKCYLKLSCQDIRSLHFLSSTCKGYYLL